MSRDDGQALVVLVALLGFAALVIVSLTDASARVLAQVQAQRAAEGAAESGGVVVSDWLFANADDCGEDKPRRCGGADLVARAVADENLRRRAEVAARQVLARLGGELDDLVFERRVDEASVRVRVRRAGASAIARVGVRAP